MVRTLVLYTATPDSIPGTPMSSVVFSLIARIWKWPKYPTADELIKVAVYTLNEIVGGQKKRWNSIVWWNFHGIKEAQVKWNKEEKGQ